MHELQKSTGDMIGIGLCNNECSTSTASEAQPQMDKGKGKYIKFVKSSVVHKEEKHVILIIKSKSSYAGNGRSGIGYRKPERRNSNQAKSRNGPKAWGNNSMEVKSYWNSRPVQKRYRLDNQKNRPKVHLVKEKPPTLLISINLLDPGELT